MADITNNKPYIVRDKNFRIDADYAAWLSEIKRRYHSAQIKAAIKVNAEKLAFNWSLGRDASEKLHQVGAELQHVNIQRGIKLHQLGGEIVSNFPVVLSLVPWRHGSLTS